MDSAVATSSGNPINAPIAVRPLLKGWSHAAAAIAAIVLCPLLIVFAPSGTAMGAAVFGICVVALFSVSGAYHCIRWDLRAHTILQRLDHSMIFVVIAATYTPIAMSALPPTTSKVILAIVWTAALGGVVLNFAAPGMPRRFQVALYLGIGWVALAVIADIWRELGPPGFALLLAGGLCHSIGAIIYAKQRPNPWPKVFGFHELFHLFVIAGIACHYVVIAFFAIR